MNIDPKMAEAHRLALDPTTKWQRMELDSEARQKADQYEPITYQGSNGDWNFIVVSFSIEDQGFPKGARGYDGVASSAALIERLPREVARKIVERLESILPGTGKSEAVTIDYVPSATDIAWTRNLIETVKHMGLWCMTNGDSFLVDHTCKVIWRFRGSDDVTLRRININCRSLGWRCLITTDAELLKRGQELLLKIAHEKMVPLPGGGYGYYDEPSTN